MALPRGEDIERMRLDAGLSRSELGRMVRLDYRTVYGIERGHTFKSKRPTASREALKRIADVLEVGLYDVMERQPPKKPGKDPTHPPTKTEHEKTNTAGKGPKRVQREAAA